MGGAFEVFYGGDVFLGICDVAVDNLRALYDCSVPLVLSTIAIDTLGTIGDSIIDSIDSIKMSITLEAHGEGSRRQLK